MSGGQRSYKKNRRLWRAVGAILVAAIGTALASYLGPPEFVAAFWKSVARVFAFAAHPVTTPLWLMALLGIVFIVVVIAAAFAWYAVTRPAQPPHFTTYVQDTVFGLNWTWRWAQTKFDPGTLRARCPVCMYDVRWITPFHEGAVTLVCDPCNGRQWNFPDFGPDELRDRVSREVVRRATIGEWPGAKEGG